MATNILNGQATSFHSVRVCLTVMHAVPVICFMFPVVSAWQCPACLNQDHLSCKSFCVLLSFSLPVELTSILPLSCFTARNGTIFLHTQFSHYFTNPIQQSKMIPLSGILWLTCLLAVPSAVLAAPQPLPLPATGTSVSSAATAAQPSDISTCIRQEPSIKAFFVMGCGKPITIDRLDPIISPGLPSAHLHTVMGGSAFNFSLTYAQTQAHHVRTTCAVSRDKSNYWVPTVYFRHANGSLESVQQVGGINVYYQERLDWTDYCAGKEVLAFPEGFRMIAGDSARRTYDENSVEQRGIQFICLLTDGQEGLDPFRGFPGRTCDGGLQIRIRFPSCWDGVGLGGFEGGGDDDSDSDDDGNGNGNSTATTPAPKSAYNGSHVAYPSRGDTGECPPTHPFRIPALLYEMTWAVDAFNHLRNLTSPESPYDTGEQPFVFSNGDKTGYGYHADFFNGWDVDLLQKALKDESCGDNGGRIETCETFKEFLQSSEEMNLVEELEQKVTGEGEQWEGVLEGGVLPGGVRVDG